MSEIETVIKWAKDATRELKSEGREFFSHDCVIYTNELRGGQHVRVVRLDKKISSRFVRKLFEVFYLLEFAFDRISERSLSDSNDSLVNQLSGNIHTENIVIGCNIDVLIAPTFETADAQILAPIWDVEKNEALLFTRGQGNVITHYGDYDMKFEILIRHPALPRPINAIDTLVNLIVKAEAALSDIRGERPETAI